MTDIQRQPAVTWDDGVESSDSKPPHNRQPHLEVELWTSALQGSLRGQVTQARGDDAARDSVLIHQVL